MSGPAHFAVLQREAGSLDADALKRAFASFTNLTDADAVRLAIGARGILLRHLRRDEANAFQRALTDEGVGAVIVDEEDLWKFPEGKSLHRLELTPQSLVVYDLLGRATTVHWEQIAMVAAATVLDFQLSKAAKEKVALRFGLTAERELQTGLKMESGLQSVMELLLSDGLTRYQIEAAGFPFKYVFDRPELPVSAKFAWLVQEICSHAPGAILNDGARCILDGQESASNYASRQALADEIVWLFWQKAQRAHSGGD